MQESLASGPVTGRDPNVFTVGVHALYVERLALELQRTHQFPIA